MKIKYYKDTFGIIDNVDATDKDVKEKIKKLAAFGLNFSIENKNYQIEIHKDKNYATLNTVGIYTTTVLYSVVYPSVEIDEIIESVINNSVTTFSEIKKVFQNLDKPYHIQASRYMDLLSQEMKDQIIFNEVYKKFTGINGVFLTEDLVGNKIKTQSLKKYLTPHELKQYKEVEVFHNSLAKYFVDEILGLDEYKKIKDEWLKEKIKNEVIGEEPIEWSISLINKAINKIKNERNFIKEYDGFILVGA